MQTKASRTVLIAAIALWLSPAFAASVHAPFVRCPADSVFSPVAPPTGKVHIIHTESSLPGPIAYYKGVQGLGVLAPSGWHCRESYGSAGAWLVVTPHRILPNHTFSFAPPVIEMSTIDGETSGRFIVAQLGSMLFPKLTKKYVFQIEHEGVLRPAQVKAEIERRKYPTDSLTYLSKRAVEFETPANERGLGTEGAAIVANAPIQGIVVLYDNDGSPIGMSVLRTSLGTENQRWASAILKLNLPCMRSANGC